MDQKISELRQDPVSDDWVLIATGRAKRPHDFLKEKRPIFRQPKSTCPFEKLIPAAVAVYSLPRQKKEDWFVQVFPNKFPAFGVGDCSFAHENGIYSWSEGVGLHEVVATRDHEKSIAQMDDEEAELLMRAYQDRYLEYKKNDCVEYVSVFHNHGKGSGATISHPHSQMLGIPVVPPDVGRSLAGSARYFHKEKKCVHCVMVGYELKERERIIYENSRFAVVAPYASHSAFEARIYPKAHEPHFERMDIQERGLLGNALRITLAKFYKGLKNPDYNFFLHTAPASDTEEFHHYHWHFEILPKTAIWAGFEIGTGIEISTIAPEKAAKFLRTVKI